MLEVSAIPDKRASTLLLKDKEITHTDEISRVSPTEKKIVDLILNVNYDWIIEEL